MNFQGIPRWLNWEDTAGQKYRNLCSKVLMIYLWICDLSYGILPLTCFILNFVIPKQFAVFYVLDFLKWWFIISNLLLQPILLFRHRTANQFEKVSYTVGFLNFFFLLQFAYQVFLAFFSYDPTLLWCLSFGIDFLLFLIGVINCGIVFVYLRCGLYTIPKSSKRKRNYVLPHNYLNTKWLHAINSSHWYKLVTGSLVLTFELGAAVLPFIGISSFITKTEKKGFETYRWDHVFDLVIIIVLLTKGYIIRYYRDKFLSMVFHLFYISSNFFFFLITFVMTAKLFSSALWIYYGHKPDNDQTENVLPAWATITFCVVEILLITVDSFHHWIIMICAYCFNDRFSEFFGVLMFAKGAKTNVYSNIAKVNDLLIKQYINKDIDEILETQHRFTGTEESTPDTIEESVPIMEDQYSVNSTDQT